MDIDTGLETKAGIPDDAVVTHGDLMRAFEAFKETNDERLARRDADVVLEEKLARIGATIDAQTRRIDEIALKAARPALGQEPVRLRAGAPGRRSIRQRSRRMCAPAKPAACARSR
jgi:predicted phage gp36 major capsid-like protein